jgi:hypothetical protein
MLALTSGLRTQGSLRLRELRQCGSPVAVIRGHDFLERGLRFMEEGRTRLLCACRWCLKG